MKTIHVMQTCDQSVDTTIVMLRFVNTGRCNALILQGLSSIKNNKVETAIAQR